VDTYYTRKGAILRHKGILMRKEQIAIIVLAVWLTIISVFMVFAGNVNFEIFFVLSLIGLLVIVELVGPKYVRPRFLWYIWYLVGAGIAIFSAIVVWKVVEILAK
jgi:hypothetical protein